MSQADESNADGSKRRQVKAGRAERRGLRRGVLLPFTVVLALVVALVGLALSLRSPVQVALLSDSMLTLLVLCPLAVCMFPLVILSLALVALLNRWHPMSRSPLRRLEAWTALMEGNIEAWLGNIDERVLNWAVKLAPLRELLTTFDPPAAESSEERIE